MCMFGIVAFEPAEKTISTSATEPKKGIKFLFKLCSEKKIQDTLFNGCFVRKLNQIFKMTISFQTYSSTVCKCLEAETKRK